VFLVLGCDGVAFLERCGSEKRGLGSRSLSHLDSNLGNYFHGGLTAVRNIKRRKATTTIPTTIAIFSSPVIRESPLFLKFRF